MSTRIAAFLFLILLAIPFASAQEEKKTGGTIVGTLKARADTKDGKNTNIEVLAPGEEKARSYFVNWDPKLKAPLPEVLKAARAAKIGDRVEFDWVQTNHGPALTSFKVVREKK